MSIKYALTHMGQIQQNIAKKDIAFFLDFDGTLAPIVARPEFVKLSDEMKQCLQDIQNDYFLAIVSGRELSDLRSYIALPQIIYSGNHGLEIAGPDFNAIHPEITPEMYTLLSNAEHELQAKLHAIPGVLIENKTLTLSIHYRLVHDRSDIAKIEQIVYKVTEKYPLLIIHLGKKVFEIRPNIRWNKGKAVLFLIEQFDLTQYCSIYLGDDRTDEDAFEAIKDFGIGILISSHIRPSAATYYLHDPDEVKIFLRKILCLTGH